MFFKVQDIVCVCVCSHKSACIGKNLNVKEAAFCIKTGEHVDGNVTHVVYIFCMYATFVFLGTGLQETQAGFPRGDKGE